MDAADAASSSWAVKIVRAERHLAELNSDVEALKSGDRVVRDVSADSRTHTFRLHASRIPDQLSAIVGDALHNMRSALDCMAFELARRGKGDELTEDEARQIQFPITRSADAFDDEVGRGRLRNVSAAAVAAVRGTQPWYDVEELTGLSMSDRGAAIGNHALSALQSLSNIDKHRRLHIARRVPDFAAYPGPPGKTVRWEWSRQPLVHGAQIGRLVCDEPLTAEEMPLDVKLVTTLDENVGRAGAWSVVERMDYLLSHVRDEVIPDFAAHL